MHKAAAPDEEISWATFHVSKVRYLFGKGGQGIAIWIVGEFLQNRAISLLGSLESMHHSVTKESGFD